MNDLSFSQAMAPLIRDALRVVLEECREPGENLSDVAQRWLLGRWSLSDLWLCVALELPSDLEFTGMDLLRELRLIGN